MSRPRLCLAATFALFALIPVGREAAAQKRRPPTQVPVTRLPAPKPDPAPPKTAAPATAVVAAAARPLPTISYGTPQPITLASMAEVRLLIAPPTEESGAGKKQPPRPLMTEVDGRPVTAEVLHLRGLDDIEKSELPEGAKRLLLIHVGKIGAAESDHYIVNPELAKQWMASKPPVPPHIKPPEKKSESKGCSTRHISMKCVKAEGEQALEKGSEAWEHLRKQAEETWNEASTELSDAWQEVRGCFVDKTLSLNDVPVKFNATPQMSIPLGGTEFIGSAGSAEVSGSIGLGFPMTSDLTAKLDLFYIPCLPFVIRPKALSTAGTMSVGEVLTASVTASGRFDKTFKIPPTGGPAIPIMIIPIVIAGVPVAVLDVSAYVEGSVRVEGKGKAEGSFQVQNTQIAKFDFTCDGKGCQPKGDPVVETPMTVTESAQLTGQLSVTPAVYTALQLGFNFNALAARVGPEPYLLATASGCAGIVAQQQSDGKSSVEDSHALTADLDWGVKFRAEALVGGQVIGSPWTRALVGNRHIWFRDLVGGGSSGLRAVVAAAPAAVAGRPAVYKVQMPACYPYTTAVHYRVSWTGSATPSPAQGCDWARGTCKVDPRKPMELTLTWPAAGNYSLTIAPVGDEHRNHLRTFEPAPKPTELVVTVTAPEG